jgi:ATP-binding cassette subfamily B protein
VAAAVRALLAYAAPYRLAYAAGVGCLLAATALGLLVPRTVQRAIEALERDATASVLPEVGLLLLLAAGNAVARLASRFAIVSSAQGVEHDVRNALYASLQRLPPAFIARQTTGDLMARATSDAGAVRSLLGFGTVSFASTVFAVVGALTAMLAIDPWLTLWTMVPFPLLVAAFTYTHGIVHAQTQATQEALGVLSARVQEYVAGMTVVRAYTMERRAAAAFDEANEAYRQRSLVLALSLAAFAPLAGLVGGVGTLIVLWVGGHAVMDGRLTLGAFVAFSGYLAYLAWPTMALGYTLALVRRGLTSMARVQEIIEAAPPPEPDGGPPTPGAPASVRFADLTFAYDAGRPVLRELRLAVERGAIVAVVGPTGSGKSTLGALLARLWEPPPGTVFLDGQDVTRLPRRALRRALGYVPQEAFLFSRTIAENVTLGRSGIGMEAARAAAAAAGVLEEVEALAGGWQTVVGERGLTVSGGQRQRLALARALAGEARVLVLDDVFASVDVAKEDEIAGGLRAAVRGRTVLLVTHRLRAARTADRIAVLDDGRIVEEGTHDDLVRAGGAYARLWRIQQLEEEIARA